MGHGEKGRGQERGNEREGGRLDENRIVMFRVQDKHAPTNHRPLTTLLAANTC